MRGVKFRLWGQIAHFLQAPYSVYWATYPIPPRTVLQGIVGAVLGLDKDTPQVELASAQFSVSGGIAPIHRHGCNLRKNTVPSTRPFSVNSVLKHEHNTEEFNVHTTRVQQEWLYEPEFIIVAHLPDQYHEKFVHRLRNQEYHYTPCLGNAGMFAMFDLLEEGEITPLPEGDYAVQSVVRHTPTTRLAMTKHLAMQSIAMPWSVDTERVFTTCPDPYLVTRSGDPIPVHTTDALQFRGAGQIQTIMFL